MKQQIIFTWYHIKEYASDNVFRDVFCELMYKITKNPYWAHLMGFEE